MARKDPDAVRITSAAQAHSHDLRHRQRRYVISMSVRTVCFLLAVVSFSLDWPVWSMWTFLVASFVLPYVAVVMANAGASTDPGGPEPFSADPSRPALEGPPEKGRG
jgi:hypothetical protein